MTVKVGNKDYNLDGYVNVNELEKALVECYQQGYRDGSLSTSEEIINKKVIGYLETRIKVIEASGIVTSQEINVLKLLIAHFNEVKNEH